MRIFYCHGCKKDIEMEDNKSLIICLCGSGEIDRICPKCRKKYDYTEQEHCLPCRATKLAQKVCTGEMLSLIHI
jgi:hypothetical protein